MSDTLYNKQYRHRPEVKVRDKARQARRCFLIDSRSEEKIYKDVLSRTQLAEAIRESQRFLDFLDKRVSVIKRR